MSAIFTESYLSFLVLSTRAQAHGTWTRSRAAKEKGLGLKNAGLRFLSEAWGDQRRYLFQSA